MESISSHCTETCLSQITESLQTAALAEDPNLRLLSRRQGVVWSAYVKKNRLLTWQTMAHQSMGQLSLADHLTTLVQEYVDEADLEDGDRSKLSVSLDILSSVLKGAERNAAYLGSHLDLTAREAELRTIDLTSVDEAEMRARPLFTGYTFGDVSRADVLAFRQNLRDEALTKVTAKGSAGSKGKKAKASPAASAQASQPPPTAGPSFRGDQLPPPQGAGKRGGKGGRFRGKGKSFSKK